MAVAKIVWIFLFIEMSKAQTTFPPELSFPPISVSKEPINPSLVSPTTIATTPGFFPYTTTTTSTSTTTTTKAVLPPTSSTTPASTTSSTTTSPKPPSSTTSSPKPPLSTTSSPKPPLSTTSSPNPPSSTTTPLLPMTTPKPMRNFTILLVFPNVTEKVQNLFEINDTVANTLKASLATKLDVDVASISNKSDIQLTNGGKPIKIVKRSADPPPNNNVTLQFDLTTSKYVTSEEVENKLKNFQIFFLNASDPLVYVWTDADRCPSQNCSSETTCTITSNATNPRYYQLNCSPVTQSSPNNGGPNLLYLLLLLLLLIPIAILIAVGCYCYHRNPGRNHLVNYYPREKLQAKFSDLPFGTTRSGKSDIIIMGGEGPPTYETNPKSTVRNQGASVGTVASIHAFDNEAFDEHEKDYGNRNGVVSNHPSVEGDNSMTFSYMQMRNSKVKDDTMALF